MTPVDSSMVLSASDPAPVRIMNGRPHAPVLLLCEHAGRIIPSSLNDLGLSQEIIDSHRGWDIGALDVAREVAKRLDAPLIIQRYSRLVIDANRPPDSAQAVPAEVDEVAIPGNVGITKAQQQRRAEEIFAPMDAAIADHMRRAKPKGCFSIHSFTPVLGGVSRPWHAGFLSRRDETTAERLMTGIAARRSDFMMAVNEPYQIDDDTDWFIPRHAEPSGAAHSLIEIRNDLIQTPEGVGVWAALIAEAISDVMQEVE